MTDVTLPFTTTVDLVEADDGQVQMWLHGTRRSAHPDITDALAALPEQLWQVMTTTGNPSVTCEMCQCPLPVTQPGQEPDDCHQCQAGLESTVHTSIAVFEQDGTWLQMAGELFGPYRHASEAVAVTGDCLDQML